MDTAMSTSKKRYRDEDVDVEISDEHRQKRAHPDPAIAAAAESWDTLPGTMPTEPLFAHSTPIACTELALGAPVTAGGRVATPMQPVFGTPVRGSWSGPGPALCHVDGASAGVGPQSVWHSSPGHHLPSPISEHDDSAAIMAHSHLATAMESDDSYMDPASQARAMPGHPLPYPAGHPILQSPPLGQDCPPGDDDSMMMDTDGPVSPISPPADLQIPPTRKGHTRSRHTINSWTWQPGMKRAFSVGYRSDCEKCQLKVPGHFNHIVIS